MIINNKTGGFGSSSIDFYNKIQFDNKEFTEPSYQLKYTPGIGKDQLNNDDSDVGNFVLNRRNFYKNNSPMDAVFDINKYGDINFYGNVTYNGQHTLLNADTTSIVDQQLEIGIAESSIINKIIWDQGNGATGDYNTDTDKFYQFELNDYKPESVGGNWECDPDGNWVSSENHNLSLNDLIYLQDIPENSPLFTKAIYATGTSNSDKITLETKNCDIEVNMIVKGIGIDSDTKISSISDNKIITLSKNLLENKNNNTPFIFFKENGFLNFFNNYSQSTDIYLYKVSKLITDITKGYPKLQLSKIDRITSTSALLPSSNYNIPSAYWESSVAKPNTDTFCDAGSILNGNIITTNLSVINTSESTSNIKNGMIVSGQGIPVNTTVTDISSISITLSNEATSAQNNVEFNFKLVNTQVLEKGKIESNQLDKIVLTNANTNIKINMIITNNISGIPTNTYVKSISSDNKTIELSQNASNSIANSVFTFTNIGKANIFRFNPFSFDVKLYGQNIKTNTGKTLKFFQSSLAIKKNNTYQTQTNNITHYYSGSHIGYLIKVNKFNNKFFTLAESDTTDKADLLKYPATLSRLTDLTDHSGTHILATNSLCELVSAKLAFKGDGDTLSEKQTLELQNDSGRINIIANEYVGIFTNTGYKFFQLAKIKYGSKEIILEYPNVGIKEESIVLAETLEGFPANTKVMKYTGYSAFITLNNTITWNNGSLNEEKMVELSFINPNNSNSNTTINTMFTGQDLTCYGQVYQLSDSRLKHSVKNLENPLDKVLKLEGKSFIMKNDSDQKTQIGMIAQDVKEIVPELVNNNADNYLSLNYSSVVALLIESIKEQQNQINELKKLIK